MFMHIFFLSRITDNTLTKLGFLVGSLLLVFSVFCVLFFFDHCIVCPMLPVSMNCPFCCFLSFIFINYTSEWVIADYRHVSNFNLYYCENKIYRHVTLLRHIIPIQSQPVIEFEQEIPSNTAFYFKLNFCL